MLILDGLILVFLAITVFFAAKLSMALKQFRDGKQEFAKLLNQLSTSTMQADKAIERLHKSTDDSGHDLQMRINSGKSLSEELQLMTEAATNLADRLENMASYNRDILARIERASGVSGEALDLGGPSQKRTSKQNRPELSTRDFSIQDKEEQLASEGGVDNFDDGFDEIDTGRFSSRAEKELADALKRKR